MKSFAVNDAHDIVIENGIVQLVEGSELKRQSAECTLNTKKGEWFFNEELGINFNLLLGKKSELDSETIRSVLMDGLLQVDESFVIHQILTNYDKHKRKLTVGFTATTENGESITLSDTWNRKTNETDMTISLANGGLVLSGGGVSAKLENGGLVFSVEYDVSIVDEGLIVGG